MFVPGQVNVITPVSVSLPVPVNTPNLTPAPAPTPVVAEPEIPKKSEEEIKIEARLEKINEKTAPLLLVINKIKVA